MLCYFSSTQRKSKAKKEARRMVCDCIMPSKEDAMMGMKPCGEDCLNRMLFIEWYAGKSIFIPVIYHELTILSTVDRRDMLYD